MDCGQPAPQADGKVTAMCGEASSPSRRFGSIRLSDGTFEPISPTCALGECNWAAHSPGGRHLAYIQKCPACQDPDKTPSRIFVDGRPVFTCAGMRSKYLWIGDDALAVRCRDELVVVGSDDGSVRSRTPLPAL